MFFFFFQAEDGIRDLIVTGVQTCALPICCGERGGPALAVRTGAEDGVREADRIRFGPREVLAEFRSDPEEIWRARVNWLYPQRDERPDDWILPFREFGGDAYVPPLCPIYPVGI